MAKASRKKNDTAALKAMADSVGDFIQYWGFRKIHGQIWALVYLSAKPLSATEIISILKMSKALISLGIKELVAYGLIYQTSQIGVRTKTFAAQEDVFAIIKEVLKGREAVYLERAQQEFENLKNRAESMDTAFTVDPQRLSNVGEMSSLAQTILQTIVDRGSI